MNKIKLHKEICEELNDTYRKKNSDYGDSVGELYSKLGDITILTRISDKYNRLMNLLQPDHVQEVMDESIDDTILDLANYAVIWLMERRLKNDNISLLNNESSMSTLATNIQSFFNSSQCKPIKDDIEMDIDRLRKELKVRFDEAMKAEEIQPTTYTGTETVN